MPGTKVQSAMPPRFFPVAGREQVRDALGELAQRTGPRWRPPWCSTASLPPPRAWPAPGSWEISSIGSRLVSLSSIDAVAAVALAFAVLYIVLARVARHTGTRWGERALARLRQDFIRRVLDLPTTVVERAGTGDLMTRVSGDLALIGTTLREAVPEILAAALQTAFILTAAFLLYPLLGLCSLVGLPLLVWASRWYLRHAREAYLAEGAANSAMAESLAASTQGARTAEMFQLQASRVEAGDHAVSAAVRTRRRTLALRSVLLPVADVAYALPASVALVVGGLLYTQGLVSLGTAVTAVLYIVKLVDPLTALLNWLEPLQRSHAAFARLEGVRPHRSPPQRPASASAVAAAGRRLEVSGVHYSYADGPEVLHDINLSVVPESAWLSSARLAQAKPPSVACSRASIAPRTVRSRSTAHPSLRSHPTSGAVPCSWSRRSTMCSSGRCATISPLPRLTPMTPPCWRLSRRWAPGGRPNWPRGWIRISGPAGHV